MLIGIVAETDPLETRVAASAETVKKFVALGADVIFQHGAKQRPADDEAGYIGKRVPADREGSHLNQGRIDRGEGQQKERHEPRPDGPRGADGQGPPPVPDCGLIGFPLNA